MLLIKAEFESRGQDNAVDLDNKILFLSFCQHLDQETILKNHIINVSSLSVGICSAVWHIHSLSNS